MMYGPHVLLHAVWSPDTHRAEKEPAGPLEIISYGHTLRDPKKLTQWFEKKLDVQIRCSSGIWYRSRSLLGQQKQSPGWQLQ
jgi:hypothetical protein